MSARQQRRRREFWVFAQRRHEIMQSRGGGELQLEVINFIFLGHQALPCGLGRAHQGGMHTTGVTLRSVLRRTQECWGP